jgi:hypothetical protein
MEATRIGWLAAVTPDSWNIQAIMSSLKYLPYISDLCLTVHLQCRQCNKIKTNYMQQITVFIDLQDQLNMFRTKICPSSRA